MAAIRFDNVKVARSLANHITRNIRLDFVSETRGERLLGPDFDRLLQEKATEVVMFGVPTLDLTVRQHYVGMLNSIGEDLATGLHASPTGELFTPFSPKYFKRKARQRPGTEYLFWKFGRSGKGKHPATLASVFRKFATDQSTKMGLGSSGKKSLYTTVVATKAAMFKNKRRYRYTLNMSLPEIKASVYRDQLFRQQFMNQEERIALQGFEPSPVFRRIMYNETALMRPWIREQVKLRGVAMSQAVDRRARELFSN